MCTVIVEVPRSDGSAVRLLAVRDEDPARAWDAPGEWWPAERPGVLGVRDRRANGAWLAARPADGRLAVILNRAETSGRGHPEAGNPLASRGGLVLDAVTGASLPERPRTANFNLVSVAGTSVTVSTWDGEEQRQTVLSPGVHMIAHHDLDDHRTERIAAWLPQFRELEDAATGEWRERWIALLDRSAALDPSDDRAIIRDNRTHGYPTLSLLACIAEVAPRRVALSTAVLAAPAVWDHTRFSEPTAGL